MAVSVSELPNITGMKEENCVCIVTSFSFLNFHTFSHSRLAGKIYSGYDHVKLMLRVKDGAYQFKGIFALIYDYAGNVDLNKCY